MVISKIIKMYFIIEIWNCKFKCNAPNLSERSGVLESSLVLSYDKLSNDKITSLYFSLLGINILYHSLAPLLFQLQYSLAPFLDIPQAPSKYSPAP